MTVVVIGLTGGIGAGKSEAARALERLGCVVADADRLAKEALDSPAIRDQVVQWWGSGMLDEDGAVDRAAVASLVFEEPDALKRLEDLIHPEVERRRKAIFEAAPAGTRALVIDAPLLLEVGLDDQCDEIIFVDAPRAVRLERVAASRGWNTQELDRREVQQLALDKKRSQADYVVVNEKGPDALEATLAAILAELL
jgi:dephospho-CoA kinase